MKKLLFVFIVLTFINIPLIGNAQAAAPISISFYNPIQIINERDDVKGMRFNLIYGANHDISGIDLGLVNRSYGIQKGFQFGVFNDTSDFCGLQLGLINKTLRLEGVQIGIVNIHYESKNKGFVPFVNWAF